MWYRDELSTNSRDVDVADWWVSEVWRGEMYALHSGKELWIFLVALWETSLKDFANSYRLYCSVVCLSVCLSVTFMHCAQTAEDIDKISLHTTAPCLCQIVLKFGLHRSTSSSPNFTPKWHTSCWFERRRHSIANCGRMVRDSALLSQWRANRKPPTLSNGTIADPLRPPLPHMHPQGDVYCHLTLANMIEERCRLLPDYFGPR